MSLRGDCTPDLLSGAVRIGYLGPEGTFTHEAALRGSTKLAQAELVPLMTIFDVVSGVTDGSLELGVVPIENSIEGSVSATLDTLASGRAEVHIVAEQIHAIEQCLIAAEPTALSEIATVMSHPQASAQCAHFLHERLPWAQVVTTSSTADAVRLVAERGRGWAALGPRLAAQRYGCALVAEGVEDRDGNATRFVWLSPTAQDPRRATGEAGEGPHKTSFVFWGDGSGRPGWLVRCLAELSNRGVNMTRIESRPLKQGLGRYMFFVDCEGAVSEPALAQALAGLREHVEALKVLGSYPAAA
ncbi:MAG TPA: prephenate dehydratase [Solirubrobacteraceae bacterium]|nr:prephenate dehydratase [Solirubrobacteraceae bacterium]